MKPKPDAPDPDYLVFLELNQQLAKRLKRRDSVAEKELLERWRLYCAAHGLWIEDNNSS